MKKSLRVAIAGIMSALCIILLYIGSVMWLFAYIMPLAAGLIMIAVSQTGSKRLALTVYIAVSLISLTALNDKECVLLYVLFFGYYPLIRESLEKIKSSFVKIILKFLIFNAAVVAVEMICIYVFMIPFDNELGRLGIPILMLLANALFFVYDNLLPKLEILYEKRIKNKIDKYLS
ncbi:MAG: hypothetical protein IJT65_00915 [Eubacterium sp.]|nr:hypothetical protein [Eubacterium sp.]